MGNKSYSKGISWINDCRIPHNEDLSILRDEKKLDTQNQGWGFKSVSRDNSGRFPANILVSDDMLNDGVVSKSTIFDGTLMDMTGGNFGNTNNKQTDKRIVGGYADKGTNSRYYDIDKWFDNLIDV